MPLKVFVTPVTPFEQNSSVLVCERTGLAAVIDPGGDLDRIRGGLAKAGARLEKILLTHAHIDPARAAAAAARGGRGHCVFRLTAGHARADEH